MKSDGTAVRSFCYITDTIKGIMDVMCKGEENSAYNLANEKEPITIKEVAELLVEMFHDRGVKLAFVKPKVGDHKGYVDYTIRQLDTSKIEELGWQPQTFLREGMDRTVRYFIV